MAIAFDGARRKKRKASKKRRGAGAKMKACALSWRRTGKRHGAGVKAYRRFMASCLKK